SVVGPGTFHAIERNEHSRGLRTRFSYYLHRLAHRGARSDHVVDDHHPALQRRPHEYPALAMVLRLLAVERKWNVAPVHGGVPGQTDGCGRGQRNALRSEEHTSELQSRENLVCRLLLEKKKQRR